MARSMLRVPDPSPYHLVRERLSALLEASTAPLALLSAPAGSGKTALAAEWAHRQGGIREVVWVACPGGDVDPWPDVLRAMGGADPAGLAGETPRPGGGPRDRAVEVLDAIERSERTWTVFLDGYDVRTPEAAGVLDLLLTHAGDGLRLVLTTRADPVLPLHRYRLAGTLLEVRAADLAFTDDEAGKLLAAAGVGLSVEDLHALNERLAGWAAGLRFAVPVLTGHPAPRELVSRAVTYNGNINAYLVEEVLDAQPPALRDLILTTCVPDALTPDLLEELTGEPAAPTTLSLMRANVFLESTPGDESSLRYVPFFRDLVRAQLAYEAPDRLRRLHRVLAAWYANQGGWQRAVAHLRLTGEQPDCGTLLVDHLLVGRLLCERPGDPLRRMAVTAPAPAFGGPHHHLLRAATALADGDHAGCAAQLRAAEESGIDSPHGVATEAVLEACLAGLAGDGPATDRLATRAEEALAALRRPVEPGADDAAALLLLARAVAALRAGEVRRAERWFEAGLGTATAAWSTTYRCRCLAHVALLHARTGDASRALAEADEALALARLGEAPTPLATTAHLARAYAALATGDLIGARAQLAETGAHPEPLWQVVRVVVAAALDRADGDVEAAHARLDEVVACAGLAGPWAAAWVREGRIGAPVDQLHAIGREPGPWVMGADGQVIEPLTPRELEVLAAMSEWLTTEEIAEKLFVSVNTVRTHVRNILTKLGVSRRNAAIREAFRLGLLTSDARGGAEPTGVGSS